METRHLGQPSVLPASPDEAVLDYVANPRGDALYLVRFTAPEFTSLCPVTGQPDFAHLVIDYAPNETIVESKSAPVTVTVTNPAPAAALECGEVSPLSIFLPARWPQSKNPKRRYLAALQSGRGRGICGP